MSGDPIEQLLADADAAAPAPPVADRELAPLVRRRHARRVAIARSAVAVSCVSLVTIALTALLNRPDDNRPQTVAMSESNRAELKQLDEDARRHARNADRLIERERGVASRPASRAVAADPDHWLQCQRAEAAQALVRSADRLYAANRDPAAAAAAYRQAIALFPETPAATLASQRIERIPT